MPKIRKDTDLFCTLIYVKETELELANLRIIWERTEIEILGIGTYFAQSSLFTNVSGMIDL